MASEAVVEIQRQREAAYLAELRRKEDLDALERRQSLEKVEREQRMAQQRQDQQWAWARKRDELRARAASLRDALRSAEDKVATADMDAAVRAASEVEVYKVRLAAAEREIDAHQLQQPPGALR